jgi:hypothetical protein
MTKSEESKAKESETNPTREALPSKIPITQTVNIAGELQVRLKPQSPFNFGRLLRKPKEPHFNADSFIKARRRRK